MRLPVSVEEVWWEELFSVLKHLVIPLHVDVVDVMLSPVLMNTRLVRRASASPISARSVDVPVQRAGMLVIKSIIILGIGIACSKNVEWWAMRYSTGFLTMNMSDWIATRVHISLAPSRMNESWLCSGGDEVLARSRCICVKAVPALVSWGRGRLAHRSFMMLGVLRIAFITEMAQHAAPVWLIIPTPAVCLGFVAANGMGFMSRRLIRRFDLSDCWLSEKTIAWPV